VVGEDGSHAYFDQDGTRFELETPQHRVVVRGTDGKVQATLGGLGIESALLNGPAALALGPNRTVYVLDRGNHRVQVYDYAGRHLQTIGGRGTGWFALPGGIAFDGTGRLLVGNTLRRRISVIDANGRLLGDFGDAERLQAPRGLAVAPDGTIHVADAGSSGIHAFDPSGRYLFSHLAPVGGEPALFRPHAIAIDPSDELVYVADPTYSGLYVSRTNGTFVARQALTLRAGTAVASAAAVHVALMPGGDVYVSASPATEWRTAT